MKTKSIILLVSLLAIIFALTSCDQLANLLPKPECEHEWVEASCESPKTCSLCNAIEGEALGHTEEIVAGKTATCTEAGLTEGKKCSVCGETLLAQEEIPAAHSEEIVAGKETNCTEAGLTEGKKCSVCGETLVAQEEIPALGHTEEIVAGKAATCTESGLTEGKKCSVCGETLVAQEEIPAFGHTEEALAGKETNCTEAGLTEGKKCSVCGETLVAQEEIPALGHTEEIVSGKAATCTEAGISEGKVCTACGEILVAQEEIPATGHVFADGVCSCGLIYNLFAGKQFVASADAAANIYSAAFGYQTLTDGIIFEEGKGRFSSKQNGGKVEATIDLGAVYDLSEFKVYLYWEGLEKFGSGFEIHVLFGGEWTTVVKCSSVEEMQAYWVDNPDSVDKEWLVFDLGGVAARQVKFTIPGQTAKAWTTLYELECSGKLSSAVEPEPDEPVYVENVFAGKQFIPTDEAEASKLSVSWWKGSGYEGLTDGIKNADNAPGRFSTVMATTGMMDATIDLGGTYELHSLKFYTYDPAAGTGAGSLGTDLLIQVYADGEWKDVVVCSDNAAVASYLVVNEGTYNDYLEFDLGGIKAEKVRFVISASASSKGTSYEEIECTGYDK